MQGEVMIWTLVLALIFFIAAPAAAEFTANEKANVHSLILGVNLIRSGLRDQITASRGAATQPPGRPRRLSRCARLPVRDADQAGRAGAQPARGDAAVGLARAGLEESRSLHHRARFGAGPSVDGTNKYVRADHHRRVSARRDRPLEWPIPSSKGATLYQNPKPASYPK